MPRCHLPGTIGTGLQRAESSVHVVVCRPACSGWKCWPQTKRAKDRLQHPRATCNICRTLKPLPVTWGTLTKLHAQHLLAGGGLDEGVLLAALQVHAMRLEVLAQELPYPLRFRWQRLAVAAAAFFTAVCRRDWVTGCANAHSRRHPLVQALMHIQMRKKACASAPKESENMACEVEHGA